MRNAPAKFVDQRTLTILIDLVVYLDQSHKNKGHWQGSAHARSAITNASLLLECIANSCLLSLELPSRLLEELDKLPPMSKLDYYLFHLTKNHINRGCRETELAADVLRLRDHIVHPKPKAGSLAGEGENMFVEYGATKSLAIALDNREWDHEAGAKVAHAVCGFLARFFIDWCGHIKSGVTGLLVLRERDLVERGTGAWVNIRGEEHVLILKWLPEVLEFLDLRSSERDA